MTTSSLLPGFRFRPTDDELVGYYLKRKVDGLGTELDLIPVVQLYKYDPWDLPGNAARIVFAKMQCYFPIRLGGNLVVVHYT